MKKDVAVETTERRPGRHQGVTMGLATLWTRAREEPITGRKCSFSQGRDRAGQKEPAQGQTGHREGDEVKRNVETERLRLQRGGIILDEPGGPEPSQGSLTGERWQGIWERGCHVTTEAIGERGRGRGGPGWTAELGEQSSVVRKSPALERLV